MPPGETDSLFTLAEIAVAMAGFSAIVVLFKRRETGTWREADADRFNGMLVHSMSAAFFCMVPSLLAVFLDDATFLWRVASALLAAQVVGHAVLVSWILETTGPRGRAVVFGGGLLVACLLLASALDLGLRPGIAPYRIGIFWHLLHTGALFAWLIFVDQESIED